MTNTAIKDAAREITERTDLRALVRRLIPDWQPIQRHEASSLSGPCPKCGDRGHNPASGPADRFYVTSTYCACRQCHPQGMDAVGLVAWLYGSTMREAVEMLDSQALRSVTPTVTTITNDTPEQPEGWGDEALSHVGAAKRSLFSPRGTAGRRYLLSRGLQPETWRAFDLGFVAKRSLTKDRDLSAPAISWPVICETSGRVVAVRYRYAGATETGDRYDSRKDSRTTDRLFGVQALPEFTRHEPHATGKCAEAMRCLFICEGEFNAMSVWQVCHETGVDVLSFGSESQRRLPAWAVRLANRYGAVVAWMDNGDKAREVRRQLRQAVLIKSPLTDDGTKWDANMLMDASRLGELIQDARLKALRSDDERESVLWQLWDVKDRLGPDQLRLAEKLAHELGRNWTPAGG